jgi:hypothetical protein
LFSAQGGTMVKSGTDATKKKEELCNLYSTRIMFTVPCSLLFVSPGVTVDSIFVPFMYIGIFRLL